ncbi:hypothetical protein IF188_04810 [Microbacterium sp. NEAU-LLC]|uniref:Uncharacterized protein n=1 Tax=Microbacterium helvum TaxID=2773713 RepID=A0ABR8NPQ9_9MICO|nr:hypothetical protein [Microbacterium helvum]MBD3941021.1 hypothetical protein [Microbacterium helvum]
MPTREEALRGAIWALLAFNALMLTTLIACALVASMLQPSGGGAIVAQLWAFIMVLGYAVLIGGAVSTVVALAGLPLAWLLARALRRTVSITAHAVAFGAFGSGIGILVLLVFAIWSTNWSTAFLSPLTPITIALTTVSVLFGWWRASRHARRGIVPTDPRSPIGIDEAFEDSL